MEGAAPGTNEPPRSRALATAALVAAVAFACFLPSLRNELLSWDDSQYITFNPYIGTLSLDTVRWAFTTFYADYWAPLSWLSLAVDRALWGLDPVGYHLTNVVLHAASAGLFFLVALRLGTWRRPGAAPGSEGPPGGRALATAALAALLFALHPLRVESVAWATERKDLLAHAFALCAVLAWLEHARESAARAAGPGGPAFVPGRAFLLALAAYALSLLGKSVYVALPAVLLLLDWHPLGRVRAERWRLVVEKVPFLVLAAGAALLTLLAHLPRTMRPLADVDLGTRTVVAGRSLLAYLRLTALPLDVSPVYLHPGILPRIGALELLPAAAAVAITAWTIAGGRKRPALLVAWAVVLLTVGPVLGFLQAGPQAMAPRFFYAAGMPLALLAAHGLVSLHDRLRSRAARRLLAAGTAAALVALAGLTVRDLGYWRDDVALWTRSIELNPGVSGRQYHLRAMAFMHAGELRRALADLDEAYAIALRKGYKGAYLIVADRAVVLRDLGDADGAIAEYGRAIDAAPRDEARAWLRERASLLRAKGNVGEAEADLRRADATE